MGYSGGHSGFGSKGAKAPSAEVYRDEGYKPKEIIPPKSPIDKAKEVAGFKNGRYANADDCADGMCATEKMKVFKPRLFVDIRKSPEAFLKRSVEIESNPFDHFAGQISEHYGIAKDKILANSELQQAFLDFRDLELHHMKRANEKVKYFSLRKKIILIVAGYLPEKKESATEFCNSYMHIEKERRISKRIAELEVDPNATPEQKLWIKKYWSRKEEINSSSEKKGWSSELYFKEIDKLNEETAKASGDKELQEDFVQYKENIVETFKLNEAKIVIVPLVTSDKPVDDKVEIKQALSTVSSDSFQLDLHDDGASVIVGPEKFPMEIRVFKNEETNKYVYYIVDKYTEDGYTRVESDNLSEALDGRYLDSYVSEKIDLVSDDSDTVDKIPDRMMISFGEKLLGNGKARGYKIEGENREVMNAMIKVLELPSVKYPNYFKKIEALNIFFEKGDNISGLRRRLLAGERPSLDDL